MGKSYKGMIKAKVVEARFAVGGKIANVSKQTGDIVKKGDLISSLDRKILQTELERQLADFEKVRAGFEVYAQKNQEPQNDLEKYLKAEKQAALNVSVKEVELAKAKLDQTFLTSPVDGVIIDDAGITVGLYTTPANSPIKIVDTSSYFFEFEIEQSEVGDFVESRMCEIYMKELKSHIEAKSKPVSADGKKFIVRVIPKSSEGLILGMLGIVRF